MDELNWMAVVDILSKMAVMSIAVYAMYLTSWAFTSAKLAKTAVERGNRCRAITILATAEVHGARSALRVQVLIFVAVAITLLIPVSPDLLILMRGLLVRVLLAGVCIVVARNFFYQERLRGELAEEVNGDKAEE